MVVVGHETIGVAYPVVALIDVLNGVQEVLAVLIVFEDGLLFISAGGYVIDGAGIFDAEGSRHGATIAQKRAICKEKDLTL
jgi:hypothetical protein